MRKRSYFTKKPPQPDQKYNRTDVGLFINYLMQDGKKTIAEKVFYQCLDQLAKQAKEDPLKVFEQAIENASPVLEIVSRRIGGANYQIPREVRPERRFFLASHWIIEAAKKRKGKPMHIKLAEELMNAFKNEGEAIKKKHNVHRMAEANRAFASFLR